MPNSFLNMWKYMGFLKPISKEKQANSVQSSYKAITNKLMSEKYDTW